MLVATYSNYRTAFKARTSLADAFRVAYQAGCVMGFALVSIGLMMLALVIIIFKAIKTGEDGSLNVAELFESVAGYGLGGSTVALFARVGGGIYTKAADVGADLVGKIEQNLPSVSWTQASESSPQSSSFAQVWQKVSTAGRHTRLSKPPSDTVLHA